MSSSRLSTFLGRYQYFKGKSSIYVEAVRSWITPAAASGAFVKYLGFSSTWSIAVAVLVPVVVEVGGFILGRFLYTRGGVETEYRLAMEKDPYKVESLALMRQILDRLRR